MGWSRIDGAARAGVMVMLSLLAACSRQPAPPREKASIAVVPLQQAPTPIAAPSRAPDKPALSVPTGPPRMQPHKTFVDPPLPPELRDDGGLIPLPPAPTPTPSPR